MEQHEGDQENENIDVGILRRVESHQRIDAVTYPRLVSLL